MPDGDTGPELHRTQSRADGLELAWWRCGAKDTGVGTLLLVHGAASNHTRWSEYMEQSALGASWRLEEHLV